MDDIIHYMTHKHIPIDLWNAGHRKFEHSGPFANLDEAIWFVRNTEESELWDVLYFKLYKILPVCANRPPKPNCPLYR